MAASVKGIKPGELFRRWDRHCETSFRDRVVSNLPGVIQMMWYVVTKVLPMKDTRVRLMICTIFALL